jgi:hypothetical protein
LRIAALQECHGVFAVQRGVRKAVTTSSRPAQISDTSDLASWGDAEGGDQVVDGCGWTHALNGGLDQHRIQRLLLNGPTMDTTASGFSEPQQSQFVSHGVWGRVTTLTEAPHVRLKRVEEGATRARLRRSRKWVPLIGERGAGTDHRRP